MGLNIGQCNYGDGDNDHMESGVEGSLVGVPRGNEAERRGDLQPQPCGESTYVKDSAR